MQKKKITNLLIGTNNKGKLREIRALLPKYVKISSVSKYKIKSPRENGNSFRENSLIKSKYFSKKTKTTCIADDSGLEINLLNKKPGIYSARWGGKDNDFDKAIKKIYRELDKKDKNWKNKKIRARFVCALSICFLDKRTICVVGKIDGYLSNKPKGKNGFGYDPIFIPKNQKKTFGEMKPSQKYKMDHRSQAFKKIKRFL